MVRSLHLFPQARNVVSIPWRDSQDVTAWMPSRSLDLRCCILTRRTGETTPKATAPKTPSKKRKNASSDDDFDGTPSKKKSTPKSAKKQQPQKLVDNSHLDEDFPKDSFDFIKNENKWEEEFA
jgi:hypothetical protein